jgi:succinyl-diaminopimelate desuccinylase
METSLRDELITLTSELMRFESTADNPEQLAAAIAYVQAYLEAIPGLHIHYSESNQKPALVVTLRDTHSPAIMLNGHVDVVEATAEQFIPQVRDGRIYGRASQDMKGSVAVLMRLIKDLAGVQPPPDIGVQLVSDEEIGGEHGTGRLLLDGWTCGFFLAAEPTDLRICYEQKGIIWLQLELHGLPAHGSRPWNGHNPLPDLGHGIAALAQRFPTPQAEAWQTTATPTKVRSSDRAVNRTPNSVQLSLDIRHIPDEAADDIVATVQACFPTAEISKLRSARPMVTPADHPAVQRLVSTTERILGREAVLYREHYGSDARFYSNQHIPAVCFGPVGAGLHSDEEWVDINSLVQVYQVLREYCLIPVTSDG